jgi:N-acetylglucosamine-6-sulfatase
MLARHWPRAIPGLAMLLFACAAYPASLAGFSMPASASAAAPDGRQPNVVVVQTDDQTMRQLNARVMPRTTRLLVRRGTSFSDYIATTAQCCPSRASLLTGQYAHNHGVTSNAVAYPALVEKANLLPVWLQRAGYYTMHVGKFMNGYERFAAPPSTPAPGWDQWRTVLGTTRYYDYDWHVNGRVVHRESLAQDHVTNVTNRTATRLVRQYAPQPGPFYLQLDQTAPHGARQFDPAGSCGKAPIPEPRDERLWARAALPRPPSLNEAKIGDKPAFLRARPPLDDDALTNLRRRWRCALETLAGVDRGVARTDRAVRDAGQLGRTVFVFTSDNGQFYGEHRLRVGKVLPYEEALRLPLVIRVPTAYRGDASRIATVRRPVANIDLAPTILDLANARPCGAQGCRTMDGRSLMPLLTRSGSWPGGRDLLIEYRARNRGGLNPVCEFAGIRTRRDLYVQHYRLADPSTRECVDASPMPVERYDLTVDPFELENMCDAGLQENCPTGRRQRDLEDRLASLRGCAGIRGRDARVAGRPFCN